MRHTKSPRYQKLLRGESKERGNLTVDTTSDHPSPSPNCFPLVSPNQPTPPFCSFPYLSSLLWLAPPCFWQGVVQSSVSCDSPLFTVCLTLVGPVTAIRKQAAFTHYPFPLTFSPWSLSVAQLSARPLAHYPSSSETLLSS